MRLKYNAPTVLTFTFLSVGALILSETVMPSLKGWLVVPGKGGFSPGSLRGWVTLFTHVMGHAGWSHLMGNCSIILLLGPMLESIYGSRALLLMMGITALVTGLLNVLLFPTGLMGASGVVFMMILLASFTNFTKGEIPLTFILVLVLYLGRELLSSLRSNDISEFAHIVGGFCGSLFGFFRPGKG